MTESNLTSSYSHIASDVEEGKVFKQVNLNDKDLIELKSILRNTEKRQNDNIGENIIKLLITILTVLLCSPIIICDLYFGLNDLSFEEPK